MRRWSLSIPFSKESYDTAYNCSCLGICILFCFGIFVQGRRKIKVPLGFKICFSKKRTEVLFLEDFRDKFRNGSVCVLLDGSLSCAQTVSKSRELGFEVIGVIRGNLLINESSKIEGLTGAEVVYVRSWRMKVLCVPILREIRKRGGEKVLKTFYYFSTNTRMPSTRVIGGYSLRWEIEVFHRIAKKERGLDKMKFRSVRMIKNWIYIVIISYVILSKREGSWLERKKEVLAEVERYLKEKARKSCKINTF